MATIFPGCRIMSYTRSKGALTQTYSSVCALLHHPERKKLYLLASGHSFDVTLIPDGTDAILFKDDDESKDKRVVSDHFSSPIGKLKYLTRTMMVKDSYKFLDIALIEGSDDCIHRARPSFDYDLTTYDPSKGTCTFNTRLPLDFNKFKDDDYVVYNIIEGHVSLQRSGQITTIEDSGLIHTSIEGVKGDSGSPIVCNLRPKQQKMLLLGMISGALKDAATASQSFVGFDRIFSHINAVPEFTGISLWAGNA
ncbi:hypothetical protein KK083_10515 [Fulvivirgaceae bacterium PWU4]|uniref:Serine protease n=1 Tax=Chryseosolibacter histidini TaxID=2782349 RepID=A0AAP2GIJ8_9BACT|nr:hypothetical protein [Chryseosolibacter histidini]MBT1697311.1 hypothetical protein [Chryseosolibacter histidini]